MGPSSITRAACAFLLIASSAEAPAQVSIRPEALREAPLRPAMVPAWSAAPSLATTALTFDATLSDLANGERLRQAVQNLGAGTTLLVSAGTWSVNEFFYAQLRGSAAAPIRIIGAPGAVITRPNAGQNTINIGGNGGPPARFVLLRGFDIIGGSYGIRVWDAEDLWIDQCRVSGTQAVGIGANSRDTLRLYITRCEVSDTASTGEGIYLGGNNASVVSRDAVIALNHVHHTGGSQGDGIEVKQGSSGCLIAENVIHDTQYPGILCYGTGGGPQNVIEGNVIWNTASNPFQVQGEAIVRNNLVFARNGPALQSAPHQGSPTRLTVVHNTFIAENGRGATLSSWANQPDMVLANNVFYSRQGDSIAINGGVSGIAIDGNVVLGPLFQAGSNGFTFGSGLADFVDVAWDGSSRDARPSTQNVLTGAPLSFGALVPTDLTGAARQANRSAGALEPGTYGRYVGPWSRFSPRLRLGAPLQAGGSAPRTVSVEGLEPFSPAVLRVSVPYTPGSFFLARVLFGTADANGVFSVDLASQALPSGPTERVSIIASGRAPGSTAERSRQLDVTDAP